MKPDKSIFFQPTFGNRPEKIVGRDSELSTVIKGLREPVGSRNRSVLFLGQRGMGKTAMLLEIADRACDEGFIVARVTAHEGMPQAIIEQVQLNGSQYFKNDNRHLSGVTAGALGFSFGLAFTESAQQQYGFRTKMSMLCSRLEEKGKGILILIDEVHTSAAMREVAASYQELVGDGKNVAICMAGLPAAVSSVLNDKVLTFLNRAAKIKLDTISVSAIRAYFERSFNVMNIGFSDDVLDKAAKATHGLPYFMQLLGYYMTAYSESTNIIDETVFRKAEAAAVMDMDDNVFRPVISPLSDNDRLFLKAMAECKEPVTTEELKKKLKGKAGAIQTYRKRLIEGGVIESPRRGELEFTIPYFREYLKKENEG